MRFLRASQVCAIVAIACFSTDVTAVVVGEGFETHRVLRAATKRSDLYRRSMRITKKFETELAYVEEENVWTNKETFASQVKVGSQRPVFTLEDHEHHLQDVQCSPDGIKLHFVDTSSARDARAATDGGLVITAHAGCNSESERAVYQVNNVSLSPNETVLDLAATRTTWDAAFDNLDIAFGHTKDEHLYRRHSDFDKIRKRQSTLAIPADTPDNVTTALFDLTSELRDHVFNVKEFLKGVADVDVPDLPIEIGCKECSTRGKLALTQGAFKFDASQIDLIPDFLQGGDDGKSIDKVITGGFMELVATGVGARVELFARPVRSGSFEVALFSVPIVGFSIPGIGKAGAVFTPSIAADFEISGTLEVNYGLDLTVPDGSSLRVEITDLGKSRLTGFQETALTPLPVSVNVTNAELLLGLAFKPSIPIGFEFLGQLKAEVTATMNLPRLDAKLSSNIAHSCGNNSNSTAPFANKTEALSTDLLALGPIALVEANVSLSMDLAFNVNFPFLPPGLNAINLAANLFTAVFPLINGCAAPSSAFDKIRGIKAPPPPPDAAGQMMTAMDAMNSTATGKALNYTAAAVTGYDTTRKVGDVAPTLAPNITFLLPNSQTVEATSVARNTTKLASSTPAATTTRSSTAEMTSKAASQPPKTTETLSSKAASATMSANVTMEASTRIHSSTRLSWNTTATANNTMAATSAPANLATSCAAPSVITVTDTVTSTITQQMTVTETSKAAEIPLTSMLSSMGVMSSASAESSTAASSTPPAAVSPTAPAPLFSLSPEPTTSSTAVAAPLFPLDPELISSSAAPSADAATASLLSSSTPAASTPSAAAAPAISITSSAAPQPVSSTATAAAEVLPPLAPVITMQPGFLVPSNASALPVQQTTGITEFTGVPIEDLPETYQDAVFFCRNIGVDYIWIDSLCIVQDDDRDWREQASRMGDIYEKSFVTIAAVASHDASEGLFRKTPDSRIGFAVPRFPWIHVRKQVEKPNDSDDSYSQATVPYIWPLYRRGWTYQELNLSPRVIRYGPEEVIWSCREKMAFEGDPSLDQSLSYTGFTNRDLARSALTTQKMWHRIVEGYAYRKLTFQKDQLPAIAAFVSRIQAAYPEKRYIAGLWEDTLRFDLLWAHYGQYYHPSGFKPTWSWISITDPIEWAAHPDSYQPLPCTKIVRIVYATTGPSVLGDIVEASITMEAPVLKFKEEFWPHAISLPPRYSPSEMDIRVPLEVAFGPVILRYKFWDSQEPGSPEYDYPNADAFAIPLIGLREGGNVRSHACNTNYLLVKETSQPGEYRRVGTGFVHLREVCALPPLSPNSPVKDNMQEGILRQARWEADEKLNEELGQMNTQLFKLV
ncbi:HET domain containing protein [Pyrenophora tritici-repentis]|nr:HET domain containing protein [Pyrenophora tritici-repentis]KAI1689336.1 HET domain containing protein [Pyrenophora tritici-repentis]